MSRHTDKRRSVNGILLLDKPCGLSSNAALQEVKRLYRARKAGHTGSLDPLASGLLPICLGEATKVSGFLLDADKHYQVVCRLGVTTTTADAEGEVLETRPVPALDRAAIESVLSRFMGEQSQVPPMYSALKHQGQRLYKLARQGVEVEREPRRIRIHRLALVSTEGADLGLEVHCSKGTYVRTLVEDIGAALGCGAHVSALRRTGVGPFQAEAMISLDALRAVVQSGTGEEDGWLLPIETALTQWPGVNLANDSAYYLRRGQPVIVPHAPTEGWVRLYDDNREFMGMGQILDDGRVAPRRLLGQG